MGRRRARHRAQAGDSGQPDDLDRPGIGFGDLVRAFGVLAPRDEGTRLAIANALGYELRPEARGRASRRPRAGDARAPEPVEGAADSVMPDDLGSSEPVLPALRERSFHLREQKPDRQTFPTPVMTLARGAALPAAEEERSLPRPPYEPLFHSPWTRALASTMAKTRVPVGPPDLDQLVVRAAAREPVFTLPRSVSDATSRVDVLLDMGDTMSLFRRDQIAFLALARRIVGTGLVTLYRFRGTPLTGVFTRLGGKPVPYEPPTGNEPLLMLTDLGIGLGPSGSAASVAAWRSFARSVRAAGNRVLALVPYPPARWPTGLAGVLDIVRWDRGTSIRAIRRTSGRG